MLGVTKDGFAQAFSGRRAQELLKPLLQQAKELTGADRVTAWLVDGMRMWSISSTSMGNALIEIPYGAGIAGKAAETALDVFVEDAYADARFNQAIDKAVGYRTRTIMCVPLRRHPKRGEGGEDGAGGDSATGLSAEDQAAIARLSTATGGNSGCAPTSPATVVLQLLNKIGEDKKHRPFVSEDATAVREALEVPIIDACDLIALTAGRRQSFVEAMHEGSESLRSSSGVPSSPSRR